MTLRTACIALSIFLAGCATYSSSVPEGYAGPTADLMDSYKVHSSAKADFFVAEKVNGAEVSNGLIATLRANRGRGMQMTPASTLRPLAAEQPVKVSVKARTHHAAPILAIVRAAYEVVGVVEFVPKTDAKYVVRGELGDEYSAVWIEDEKTGQVMGSKIEKTDGSARLNFFQK